MGKTSFQAGKAARYAGGTDDAAGEQQEFRAFSDGMADVTYHTPAWHQARIEQLMKPRMSYEEWKVKQKEAEGKMAEVAEQEERRMREYRAELDADRARRLAKGTNHQDLKDKIKKKKKDKKKKKSKSKKDKKDKKSKKDKKDKKSSKKRKRGDSSSSSSSSSSSDSSSSGSSSDSDGDSEGA
eukprot:CAMPEP_0202870014 /NCGR_PEP_ID=MMETSP1391-20130828/14330_1 /ASSEMBLY_ACC=CAM_ASM_000867 /TAXON_ID=1034604 /ORGANISM="Chlamydomonas leiostraca, Strain SAG 11-49" /LENGTH=182 /DNA_ID=CAMNT_0049550439 /DNA_START=61 /DNA_END=605 /DNA_ORIENTATION=-